MQGFLADEPPARPASADPVPGDPSPSLPIMFLHIPRTAGFTLKTMLESIFGTQRSLLDAHFYDTPKDELARYAVVEGHVRTRFFLRGFGPQWYRNGMTLVREPIARAVSQARHTRARPDDKRHHLVAAEVGDADELFSRVPLWFNLQTKLLSSRPHDSVDVDDVALEDAKATLDRMAFGLTEEFELSTALFAERWALALPRLTRMNASGASGDDDLRSDEFRAAAREHNLLDLRLHEYARTVFGRRVDEYVENLLAMPLDDGRLDLVLETPGSRADEVLAVPKGAKTTLDLGGWALVDDRPADAVLVRAGTRTIPLCCRVFSPEAARLARDSGRRFAGVMGRVPISEDTETVEVTAIDRTAMRRAQRTIDVCRVDPEDQTEVKRGRGFRDLARRALGARPRSGRSTAWE